MAFSLAEGRDVRRIKDIQRYTKTKIARKDLPTLQEIEERQTGILLEKIKEEVDKGGLGKYEEMLNLLLEEDYSSFDVATVLLKFYLTKNKLGSHTELNAVDYGNKGITAMTRLYINVGKRKGVSPRHIVGAILNETSLPRKSVGKIDMYDKFAFVEVPEEYAEEAVKELNNKRIKGIVVRVELANPKNR
ncbi:MAG TPA: hypothetical protein GX526_05965 [Thermoanaerobacterales bacterium]|nr:hypothetical protein [Thermoanaerobacterales bacterium]